MDSGIRVRLAKGTEGQFLRQGAFFPEWAEFVPDEHLYNLGAWERLLSSRPERANEIPVAIHTAPAGWKNGHDLTYDGRYVYQTLESTPWRVLKIDPLTMTLAGVWEGDNIVEGLVGIISDRRYIYVTAYTNPPRVVKIDPQSMTEVGRWTGTAAHGRSPGITYDGEYIYASLETGMVKIDPSTMSMVAEWVSPGYSCYPISFDGLYLYVGGSDTTDPDLRAVLVKIDRNTMTDVATWVGAVGQDGGFGSCFDGTYVYLAINGDFDVEVPGQVVKINPNTMTTVATWVGANGTTQRRIRRVLFNGRHIYALSATVPAYPTNLVKIDRDTMTTISVWQGAAGQSGGYGLTTDGLHIFLSIFHDPARVIRKIMRDIDEVGV